MKWPKKSRSLRRVARRTPGGRKVIHLKQRRKGKARCAKCKCFLFGVSHKGAKSEKKPSRPFGGYLCSKCMRQKFRKMARDK